jgi:prefoldin subunit 4
LFAITRLYFCSYKIGETFVHIRHSRALTRIAEDQAAVDLRAEELTRGADECQKGMTRLKATLYGKFGKSINLDE